MSPDRPSEVKKGFGSVGLLVTSSNMQLVQHRPSRQAYNTWASFQLLELLRRFSIGPKSRKKSVWPLSLSHLNIKFATAGKI